MGKYVSRASKIILFTVLVRFNYTAQYYPGFSQVEKFRERQVARRQINLPAASYRQLYTAPVYNPQLFIGNGPAFLYQKGSYGIIVK